MKQIRSASWDGRSASNREKPFNDALRIALLGDPLRLRRIAEKLAILAEEGDLAAIRELADRLDGKPAQVIDRRDVPIEELTDLELQVIVPGGLIGPWFTCKQPQ
jgi:hypothetical protein